MNESFQPELLSALLDGRLSSEQKATVEAHLASHPKDAQIYQDLKHLRRQLRGLPALSAPANLSEKVLQNIQTSEPESATIPVPSVQRSFRNTAWMIACAASLIGLVVVGVDYRLNRNESNRIAESQNPPAKASTSPSGEIATSQTIPADTEEKADPLRDLADVPNNKPGPMPMAVAPIEFAGGRGVGGALKADELPGAATIQEPLIVEPKQAIAADNCVSFDQLIIVQIPTGQTADTWIASVFQRADVQVDANEPNSFAEQLRQRELALAKDLDDQATLSTASLDEKQESEADVEGLANKLEKSPPVVPGLVDSNAPATAYLIEAEVEQVRQILDRLNETTIVGFPNPSLIVADDSKQSRDAAGQKAFPANPAIARRLPTQFMMRGQSAGADNGKSITDETNIADPPQSQRVMDALGLENHPAETRHRILFVFHAAVPAQVEAMSKVEPIAPAAPANK